MTKLHPAAKACGKGYLPMVIARNERGQCAGSVVCRYKLIPSPETARMIAKIAAIRVSRRTPNLVVAR